MIIAVEGIDGAGKQTLVESLIRHFDRENDIVTTVAFPRYTAAPYGTAIGEALKAETSVLRSSIEAMSVMYAVDRWHWWNTLDEVYTVCLADRWCASNAAYGSARMRLDDNDPTEFIDWVDDFEFGTLELPKPDLTLLLATGEQVAASARQSRAPEDAYEATAGLQDHALDTYLRLADRSWGGRWLILDPMTGDGERRTADDLASEVSHAIKQT